MSKGAETRERIVSRALEIASLEGLDGITIGRLAEKVGLSKSGLFAHFRSKEELQLAVIRAAGDAFTEVVVRPALSAPRGEPRVRALFDRWLDWERHVSVPGGCVFMHLSVELDDQEGPARDALVMAQRWWLEALSRAASLATSVGHFRAGTDAELFAFQLHGILQAYYHAKRLMRDPQAEDRARRAFDALVASVSSPT
ncbi:MAG TPA: TetR/AcrR family transcriptional regulator [Gemmatimonadaceae bacterium]|nr:TetR/AcrR family transcriptional regulator [Gemmatimonadaceae bacterium]